MQKDYSSRLEKVALASSTTKIKKELNSIFEGSEEENNKTRRRWIWELIQNASDCTPKGSKIDINLEISEDRITFSHNGLPFTYDNLHDLITQVSTKEEFQEAGLTGKYGTGFMSTFLLSTTVKIDGNFKRNDGTATNMHFLIQRTKRDYVGIKEQTKSMLESLESLDRGTDNIEITENATKFTYDLNENNAASKQAVRQGGEDLVASISYLLAFNDNIKSVNCNGQTYEKVEIFSCPGMEEDINVVKIKNVHKGINGYHYLFYLRKDNIEIACPIRYKEGLFYFNAIPDNLPKIFCNFPLVGTENFVFPIMMNSDRFEVTENRDAIRDGNEGNSKLIEDAVSLYKQLIDVCVKKALTRDEFNICFLKKPLYKGLQEYCFDEIYSYIKSKPLVLINKSQNFERKSYLNEQGEQQIFIPKAKKEKNNMLFWKISDEGGYIGLPTEETYLGWKKVFGGGYSMDSINSTFENKTLIDFNGALSDETEACNWLDKFYSLWIDDAGMENVSKLAFVPTQSKNFNHFGKVYYDKEIREDLKAILFEILPTRKNQLIDQRINSFNSYYEEGLFQYMDTESIAKSIDIQVNNILVDETSENTERTKELQATLNKLNDFFIKEKTLSEEMFTKVYPKRLLVSSTQETLRRMELAEKVESSGIDLDEYLINQEKIKEILSRSDLGTEEIRDILKHVVTSSPEMKARFDGLLQRSVKNVYEHLKKSWRYEVPETLEKWIETSHSETIFQVIKDQKELTIVIRPTDNNQIIFYGEDELEVLDSSEYELWTDNGETRKEITLGELLKTTGITRIPLQKI